MTPTTVKRLTVAKLRAELKARGEPQTGLKAVLVQRLVAALQREQEDKEHPVDEEEKEEEEGGGGGGTWVVTHTSGASVAVLDDDVPAPSSQKVAAASAADRGAASAEGAGPGSAQAACPAAEELAVASAPNAVAAGGSDDDAAGGGGNDKDRHRPVLCKRKLAEPLADDGQGSAACSTFARASVATGSTGGILQAAKKARSAGGGADATAKGAKAAQKEEEGEQASNSNEVDGNGGGDGGGGGDDGDGPRTLRVFGLVRPFRTPDLKAFLARAATGDNSDGDSSTDGAAALVAAVVADFWVDRIKSSCLVTFTRAAQAAAAAAAVNGVTWPARNAESVLHAAVVRSTATATEIAARVHGGAAGAAGSARTVRIGSGGAANAAPRPRSPRAGGSGSGSGSGGGGGPTLDQLFKRTKAKPSLFWKPVAKSQVLKRKLLRAREEREAGRRSEGAGTSAVGGGRATGEAGGSGGGDGGGSSSSRQAR